MFTSSSQIAFGFLEIIAVRGEAGRDARQAHRGGGVGRVRGVDAGVDEIPNIENNPIIAILRGGHPLRA
jgi:hypothetical protein